jgi:hypothetical protein
MKSNNIRCCCFFINKGYKGCESRKSSVKTTYVVDSSLRHHQTIPQTSPDRPKVSLRHHQNHPSDITKPSLKHHPETPAKIAIPTAPPEVPLPIPVSTEPQSARSRNPSGRASCPPVLTRGRRARWLESRSLRSGFASLASMPTRPRPSGPRRVTRPAADPPGSSPALDLVNVIGPRSQPMPRPEGLQPDRRPGPD